MTDATSHEILAIDPEEGVDSDDVSLAALRSGLESEDDQVRTHAAKVAAVLAQSDVDAVVDLLDALGARLDDRWNVVVYQTMIALHTVAEERPAELEPVVPEVVGVFYRDLPVLKTLTARTLGHLAVEDAEALTDHVDALLDVVREDPEDILGDGPVDEAAREDHTYHERINREGRTQQTIAREIVANALVEVAEADVEAVTPHVSTLIGLLDEDEDASVVSATADVVGTIGRSDAGPVDDAVGPLCDLLDHRDDAVVANAVSALGYVGDPAAVAPLEAVAEDDERDEELRELAADTADFLAAS